MIHRKHLLVSVALLLALLLIIPLTASASDSNGGDSVRSPRDFLNQFSPRQFPNERPPRDDQVAAEAAGVAIGDTDAIDAWYSDFYHKKEKGGPNPIAYAQRMAALQQAEAMGLSPKAAGLAEVGEAKMLMIPFEFNGTDEIPVCEDDLETPVLDDNGDPLVDTVTGPLHGTIPNPAGTDDNFSIWTDDFSVEWYQNLMFGDGVGVVRPDLNGGAGVDLTGVSATKWYEEQSEGQYTIDGDIYPAWVQLPHSVAYYGWDGDELNPEGTGYPCGGTQSGFGFEFTIAVVDGLNALDPNFDWAQYDTDGDQIVDHLMVIHAGVDNSAGGGDYGNYQLWAHSWDVYTVQYDDEGNIVDFEMGYQVDGMDTPEDTSDDIYISNYTHIPEDADIGVVVHEYGHDIGLPDYYDTSGATSNSTAHWINMASGSWSGDLGGSHPAPFNPWGRYFFGWEDPMRVPYDADPAEYMIGQSEPTPADTYDSVWIDLPDQGEEVPNLAGDGAGLHTILGNNVEHTVTAMFDLGSATAPVFTFDTSFIIEEVWDYTYLLGSSDGENWDVLLNEEGEYATTDPNGSLAWLGEGGLTGEYEGSLTYDLSAYAGGMAYVQFLYITDAAYQDPGMWIDNLSVDDGETNLYSNDLEDTSDLEIDGWQAVPYDEVSTHYYMLEWRNGTGSIASHGQTQLYYFVSANGVDKFSANVPGLLVWYRNNYYENNNAVAGGRFNDAPASGPKGELLLVDSHFEAPTWSGGLWDPNAANANDPGVGNFAPRFSNRRGAMDGAFGLNTTPAWMIHDYADVNNEVMDFGSRPAVPTFHDSLASVPGWVYPGGSFVYRIHQDISVVIPADGEYTTRIRGLDDSGTNLGDDVTGFWGFTVSGRELGSGNPGDSMTQYGVHVQVEEQAADGSYGKVKIWNAPYEVETSAVASAATAMVGETVEYHFNMRNVGSMADFVGFVSLPAGASYVDGSAHGGLIPVGDAEAALAAAASGQVGAMAATAAENVTGFLAIAADVPAGASGEMGFSAVLGAGAAGTSATSTATWYDIGYGGDFMSAWRSVSASVDVLGTATLPLMYDTWVNGGIGAENTNNNGYANITVRSTGLDNGLFTFDRSMLPAGASIVSAELKLNVTGQSGAFGKSLAALNTGAFDSMTVTYNNAPATFNPSAAVSVPDAGGEVTIDVTALLAAWDASANQLAVAAAGPPGRVVFDSLESFNGKPAVLTVVYGPAQ
ncbi:MAG: immune inhibitor A [Caldilineales bacterium]|nr:immune inhibitor A [Caldilineales bacterium]